MENFRENLVSWWSFNNTLNDTNNNNNAIAAPNIQYRHDGKGVVFDITRPCYISIPYAANLANQRFTIETWVKPTGVGGVDDDLGNTILQFDHVNPQAPTNELALSLFWSARDSKFVFCYNNRNNKISSNTPHNANHIYHVVASYDGSAFKLYVDSILQGSLVVPNTNIPYSNQNLMIGAASLRNHGSDGMNRYARTWNGEIYTVRIYNRSLIAEEISCLYNTYKNNVWQPITALNYNNYVLSGGTMETLASFMTYNTSLTELDLRNPAITPNQLNILFNAINANRRTMLTTLRHRINHNNLNAAIGFLASFLQSNTSLKELDLRETEITTAQLRILLKAIQSNPRLPLNRLLHNVGNNTVTQTITNLLSQPANEQARRQWLINKLENRETMSFQTLFNQINLCIENYGGIYATRLEDMRILDECVSQLLDIETAELKRSDLNYFRYLAHLVDMSGTARNTEGNINLEGWFQLEFLPARIRYLFELIMKIETDTIREVDLPDAKNVVLNLLYKELLTEIETFKSLVDAKTIYSVNNQDNLRNVLLNSHAKNLARKIGNLKENEEYCYSSGYRGHAVYVNFLCQNNHILVRVDNLGESSERHPSTQDKAQPFIIARVPKFKFVQLNADCLNYLMGICQSNQEERQVATSRIYYKFSGETNNISNTWPFKKLQMVGNCVVKNHNVGLQYRLALPGSLGEEKRLYTWLRNEERRFVAEKHEKEKIIIRQVYRP